MSSTSTEAANGRETFPTWLLLCAAGPGAAVVFLTITLLMLAARGSHPLWPESTLSLSEAAALRDAGEVERQLAAGADPDAAVDVRAGILDSSAVVVTPLHAAVTARRAEVVALLLARGASPAAEEWTRLSCLARQRRAPDVEEELRRWSGRSASCPQP